MKIKNEKNQFDASSRILSCLLLLQYLLKKYLKSMAYTLQKTNIDVSKNRLKILQNLLFSLQSAKNKKLEKNVLTFSVDFVYRRHLSN